ncbi:type II toxin-antitoxin system HicA family toxin [Candidatus Sumerlaeota bacterium]|nr:type II toxin-antitoxin system HicA family toxin [Candidatus Sumerlaeota bacterium]
MSRLRTLRSKELVSGLRKAGFEKRRQSGSHLIMKHADGRRVTVPLHNRDLKRPTMKAILREAGLTEDQLRGLLK